MNPSDPPSGEPRRARRTRGARVGLVLLLVATVPVVGIGGLAVQAVRSAQSGEDDAIAVADRANDAVRLTELDGAVFEEMVWASVVDVVSTIDAPSALLTTFLDTDPTVAMAAARYRTDALVAALDPSTPNTIATTVGDARAAGIDRREAV